MISGAIGSNVTSFTENNPGSSVQLNNIANFFTGGLNIQAGNITTGALAAGVIFPFGAGSSPINIGFTSGTRSPNLIINTAQINTIENPIFTVAGGTGTYGVEATTAGTTPTFIGPITLANNIQLENNNTGDLMTFSGGITGTGNLQFLLFAGSGGITMNGAALNFAGTIADLATSAGTGTATVGVPIGSGVTAITESSTTSPLTISGALTVNSSGTTLTNAGTTFTQSGSISGTGNLTIANTSAANGAFTVSSASIANVGNITINANGAQTINLSGTTIANVGNLTINANTAGAINLSGTTLNNTGTITNSGSSTGTVTISAAVGSSVTSVTQSSSGSKLIFSNIAAPAYTGPTTITAGTLELAALDAAPANPWPFASAITVGPSGTLQLNTTSNSSTLPSPTINLSGTLTFTSNIASAAPGYVVWQAPLTVAGAGATINISPTQNAVAYTNGGNLYIDGGLQGSAPIALNGTTPGYGLIVRSSNSDYSGTITITGTESATGTGSGLAVGSGSNAVASLPNANIVDNGTIELGNAIGSVGNNEGMGQSNGGVSGTTFAMNALTGAGVVVSNMSVASSTRAISVGNNNGGGTFSGIIANGTNDALSFIKNGTGTEILSGTSNSYTGPTVVNNGTLSLTGSLNSGSQLAVAGGTFTASVNQTMNGLSVNAGASTVNETTPANTLAVAAITRSIGGTADFNSPASPGAITYTSVAGQGGSNGLTNSLLGNGGGWATFGSGTSMQYATTTSVSSPYTISGLTGTPALTAAAFALGTANYEYSLSGGTDSSAISALTANTVHYTGTGGETVALSSTLTINGLMNASSGSLTISGGSTPAILPGSTNELVITGNQPISISSIIGNNGATSGALTSNLTGATLTLSGANTFTGGAYVGGGTLNIAADNNLGTNTLTVTSSLAAPANGTTAIVLPTVTLPSGTLPAGFAVGSTLLGQTVMSIAGSGPYTVTLSNYAVPSAGSGSGIPYLEAVNLDNGTLQYNTGSSLSLSETNVNSDIANRNVVLGAGGGTIDVAPSDTLTIPGLISGSGSLTVGVAGTGTLALTNIANTYTGGTNLNNGTLAITGDLQLGTPSPAANLSFNGGTLSLGTASVAGVGLGQNRDVLINSGGATFNTAASTTSAIAAPINGSGGLTKSGTGTLILANNNTYTGATIISQGTLQLPSLPAQGSLIAAYSFANSTVSGTTVNNIAPLTPGQYNGTLTSAYTYQGNTGSVYTTASAGVLATAPSGYVLNTGSGTVTVNGVNGNNAFSNQAIQGDGGLLAIAPTFSSTTGSIPTTGGIYTASAWFYGYFGAAGGQIPTVPLPQRASGTTPAGSYSTLIREPNVAGTESHLALSLYENANNQQLGFYNGGATGVTGSNSAVTTMNYAGYNMAPYDGAPTWNQITVVGNGTAGTSTYYINGVAVGSVNVAATTGIATIGNIFNGSQTFAQYLSNVYVYNTPLSATQVMQLYAATANTANLSTPLPTTTPVTIASGATLDLNGNSQTVVSLGNITGSGGTVTNKRDGHYVHLDAGPGGFVHDHLQRQYPERQRPGQPDHQRQQQRHAGPRRRRQHLHRRHHDHQRDPATGQQPWPAQQHCDREREQRLELPHGNRHAGHRRIGGHREHPAPG